MELTSTLEEYNPDWPKRYAEAAADLAPIFGGQLVEMHHVGSTAVPQLAAKPEIDVLAVVSASDTPALLVQELASLGYRRGKDLSEGHRFFKRDIEGVRTHKLHICVAGHVSIHRMLAFRDHLRTHPADRDAYAALKLRLAATETGGIAEYLSRKRPFIDEVLARAET
jgi:GrpB-like predicted nucleotidyltransferase (UPF0157 family)